MKYRRNNAGINSGVSILQHVLQKRKTHPLCHLVKYFFKHKCP